MFGRQKPIEVKKRYKKSLLTYAIERGIGDTLMRRKGYVVFSEAEVKQYSGGKGLILGLLFLPLALLGGVRYMEVTYRLENSNKA